MHFKKDLSEFSQKLNKLAINFQNWQNFNYNLKKLAVSIDCSTKLLINSLTPNPVQMHISNFWMFVQVSREIC